jgi:opacity protein-like surface antigen
MRLVAFAVAASLMAGAASAEDDGCIENAAGQTVCGVDADAVRARMRAEDRLETPGMNEPAGATSVTAPARAYVAPSDAEMSYADEPDAEIESRSGVVSPVLVNESSEEVAAPEPPAARRGSVYSSYDRAIFLRPGYIFAARGAGSFDAPAVATGYRSTFHRAGRSAFAWEGELHYLRDSEDFLVLGVPTETSLWGLTGLGGVRWTYALSDVVSPFASIGVGPSYFRGKVESGGITVADGDFTVAYSGRTGLEFNISEQFSLETAYRYLGTTQSGTPGFHSAEVGLNLNF